MNMGLTQTFTVTIDVFAWMKSSSDASKHLLLRYLEDIAESMDFRQPATACALASTAVLWFTFANEHDANDFCYVAKELYRLGGWLGHD